MNEILIVFEDPTLARALANAARFWGYQCRLVGTREDIGEENSALVPSVILLELTAAMSDTINRLNEIQSNSTTASVPVIVIAFPGAPDYKQVFVELGAFDYLGSNWSLADLRRLIELAIENRPPLD